MNAAMPPLLLVSLVFSGLDPLLKQGHQCFSEAPVELCCHQLGNALRFISAEGIVLLRCEKKEDIAMKFGFMEDFRNPKEWRRPFPELYKAILDQIVHC